MRRSEPRIHQVALAALLLLPLAGCDDDSPAKADGEKRKADAAATLKFCEDSADDPAQFAEVMKSSAKGRVLAWDDQATKDRLDAAAKRAREARGAQLDKLFAKAHEAVVAALDKKDPAESEKACSAALDQINHLAPTVAAHAGPKVDEDRRALVTRIGAAKRAADVMAKAKVLAEESGPQARALVKSFDLVPELKESPFEPQVIAMLGTIPEKAAGAASGGPAGSGGGGDEIVLWDGSDDDQFRYFDREHLWVWDHAKPGEEPAILGDNTENGDSSSLFLGDDTWGDLVLDVTFIMKPDSQGMLCFHTRMKDEQTFDAVPIENAKLGEWTTARLELKGNKAVVRVNGQKNEQDLQNPKGKLGITCPGGSVVKVRMVKLRLLDKDAKKPEKQAAPKEGDDEELKKKPSRRKKGDKGAGGAETPEPPKK
jgi:hypothetical protein